MSFEHGGEGPFANAPGAGEWPGGGVLRVVGLACDGPEGGVALPRGGLALRQVDAHVVAAAIDGAGSTEEMVNNYFKI